MKRQEGGGGKEGEEGRQGEEGRRRKGGGKTFGRRNASPAINHV